MHYVDLGTLTPTRKKKSKKKKVLKIIFLVLLFVIGTYLLALLFLPNGNGIKEVLKPATALSLINDPLKQLKNTDGRTNILVLGIDKRKDIPYTYKGSNGKIYHNGFNTDTMLIASIDINSKDIVLISLPRDLWLEFGGSNSFPKQAGRVNSIYSLGDSQDYSGGGLALVKESLSKKFGINIHYGVRVDFEAFRSMVTTVGGVEVTVAKDFDDYEYPVEGKEDAICGTTQETTPEGTSVAVLDYSCRYQVLHFKAGLQHMDGDAALAFARSRHGNNGEGSDFARATRQQLILVALKAKILSAGTLLDPLKVAGLINNFGQSVQTDFDLAAIPGLLKIGKNFDDNKTRHLVLSSEGYAPLLTHPDPALYNGAWVLTPKDPTWGGIQTYIRGVLAGLPITPSVSPTPTTSIKPSLSPRVTQ